MGRKEAYAAAVAADDAWGAELRKRFGKRAGDARYTKAGEGEPGSDLNRAFLAYRATAGAWRAFLVTEGSRP